MSQVVGLAERKVPRRPTVVGKDGRTKQSMAAECDINNIMAKFVRTGTVDHFAKHGLHYGDFPAMEYRDCLDSVMKAQAMFADLPAKVRDKFHNEPAEFLAFVQDEKNVPEMRKLGLCKPEEVERVAKVEIVKGVETPAKPA